MVLKRLVSGKRQTAHGLGMIGTSAATRRDRGVTIIDEKHLAAIRQYFRSRFAPAQAHASRSLPRAGKL
jgi:hypothetical protein